MRAQHADARLAEDLRAALVRSALAGTIAAPVTHSRLLEMIVETAAQVISSQAASLFLVDEERRELVFEIALGQKAEEVKKFRVPLGHGIAGHVASTGQPTATSGTVDPRQAREIGESVGYIPRTILCVPLFYADRVIGVLELLDKADDATFTMLDMHVLGLFANLAAVAVEQSRTREDMSGVISDMVLESSDAVGGRTRSLSHDGYTLPTGAIFLMSVYEATHALIAELGHTDSLVRWRAPTALAHDGRRDLVRYDSPVSNMRLQLLTVRDRLRLALQSLKIMLRSGPSGFDPDRLAAADTGEDLESWTRRTLGDNAYEYKKTEPNSPTVRSGKPSMRARSGVVTPTRLLPAISSNTENSSAAIAGKAVKRRIGGWMTQW